MQIDNVIIIGAGAWGTAIATLAASNCDNVVLLANSLELAAEINTEHVNRKHLPGIAISKRVKAVSRLAPEDVRQAGLIFVATPASAVAPAIADLLQLPLHDDAGLIVCSKGLAYHHNEAKFFSQLHKESSFSHLHYAALSGPNFASEVAQQVPTRSTIASRAPGFSARVKNVLVNDHFNMDLTDDPLNAEICGVYKNVIAIGCGITDGLALGGNAAAAVVVQGLRDILVLCKAMNTCADLCGPAGFGDIFLTCAFPQSRNNAFGRALVEGTANEQKTVEGIGAIRGLSLLAKKLGVQLKLCQAVHSVVQHQMSKCEIKRLMSNLIVS